MLKNGQTYFKNLVVLTPQYFKIMCDYFSVLPMKVNVTFIENLIRCLKLCHFDPQIFENFT